MQRVKVNKSKQKRVILGFKKEQNGYLATESIYSTFSKSENKIKWFYDTSVSLCFHYQINWTSFFTEDPKENSITEKPQELQDRQWLKHCKKFFWSG